MYKTRNYTQETNDWILRLNTSYTNSITNLQTQITNLDNEFKDLEVYAASNVKSYGAQGDGVTDDTISIQAAFDANVPLYFPKGVYRCTEKITSSNKSVNTIPDNVRISNIMIQCWNPSYTGDMLSMKWDSRTASTMQSFSLNNVTIISRDYLDITGTFNKGIYVLNANIGIMNKVYINGDYGFRTTTSCNIGLNVVSSIGIMMSNCEIWFCNTGIFLTDRVGIPPEGDCVNNEGFVISDSTIVCKRGILAYNVLAPNISKTHINTGGVNDGNGVYCIKLAKNPEILTSQSCKQGMIMGCLFYTGQGDEGQPIEQNGIDISDSSNFIISENVVYGFSYTLYNIYLVSSDYCVISNNSLNGNGTSNAIYVNNSSEINISNNTVRNGTITLTGGSNNVMSGNYDDTANFLATKIVKYKSNNFDINENGLFTYDGSGAIHVGRYGTYNVRSLYADPNWGLLITGNTDLYLKATLTSAAIAGVSVSTGLDEAFIPYADASKNLGALSRRWNDIYAVNNVIQTSDLRYKTAIENSPLGLNFINSLRPVKFKFIEREKKIYYKDEKCMEVDHTESLPGIREHYGMIAQEVKTAYLNNNVDDFAGYCYDDTNDMHSLRYNEFIAPMIKSIQELNTKIDNLTTRVAQLEST